MQSYFLKAYQVLKLTGALPHGGGWLQEDPKLIHALLVIDEEVQKFEEKKIEREMKSARRKSR